MDNLSKHERRLLKHKLKEGLAAKAGEKKAVQERKTWIKKGVIAFIIFALLSASIGYAYYSYSISPGSYDDFAKCLTEKEAIMYGAIEWCKYTQEQAGMFGKSFKYINYKDYKEGPDIKRTPTWFINGERYENTQSFERLAALTGCKI